MARESQTPRLATQPIRWQSMTSMTQTTPAGLPSCAARYWSNESEQPAPATEPHAVTSRTASGPLPLSVSQSQLWYLSQLAPDSPAYNELITIRKTGPLDVEALHCALTEVVARHEAWRTTFRTCRRCASSIRPGANGSRSAPHRFVRPESRGRRSPGHRDRRRRLAASL